MTQEDKELLLKDLSARLPYGTILNVILIDKYDNKVNRDILLNDGNVSYIFRNHWIDYKPYLRSMDCITPYEQKEYNNILKRMTNTNDADILYCYSTILQNFFLSHHIDNRGLIEKGLALEAPEGMYNLNNE